MVRGVNFQGDTSFFLADRRMKASHDSRFVAPLGADPPVDGGHPGLGTMKLKHACGQAAVR